MALKRQFSPFITSLLQYIWFATFLIFPLFFLTITTEYFVLPKQIIVTFVVLVSIIALGVQMLLEKKVKMRSTVFDLPIFLFGVSVLLSSIFSASRIDSLITFVPFLMVIISYFLITNAVKTEQTAMFFLSALTLGGCIAAVISIAAFFKIYLLPLSVTNLTYFTSLGSVFDAAVFFVALLPMTISLSLPILRGKPNNKAFAFLGATIVLVIGSVIEIYQLFTTQQPLILPFSTGFQIAFAAISQDTPRIAQGFFFGSGVGTFFTDFTRFKQVAFNANQNLWFVNFGQSSSFVLELLATTGVVGIFSFFFIIVKTVLKSAMKVSNPAFFSAILLCVASFLIPFSFTTLALFFFVLGMFASIEGLKHPEKSFDFEFFLVSLRKNLFNMSQDGHQSQTTTTSTLMPILIFTGKLIFVGIVAFYAYKYVAADYLFNQSLIAASKNQGSETYQKQVDAISMFPYRESFYRIFSQTNLSIANSLLTTASANGAKPSDQVQSTALSLIQQSINVARAATTLSPFNALEWQNLAGIYRALIGFGQNADSFAVASMQQSIALDPANPQEYIALGGIYYQMGDYDNAIRQFQTAINVKPDLANAYYNLGHAYEQKKDYQNSLTNLLAVKTLVAQDKTNLNKINDEIDALQKLMGSNSQTQQQTNSNLQPVQQTQQPLNIQQAQTQLPSVSPEVRIPAPQSSPTPTK